MGNIDNQTSAQ